MYMYIEHKKNKSHDDGDFSVLPDLHIVQQKTYLPFKTSISVFKVGCRRLEDGWR